jgi:ubiquinone/menaquinone biosynthesis C-methylase UbiE
MLFYDNRYSVLSRALNKLSNVPMLFYDKRLIRLIMETRSKKKVTTVLDVGAGQGTDAIILSENCVDVVAIDISRNALLTAKILSQLNKAQNNISPIQADVEHLPFKEEVFDVVYCKDLLHHVSNSTLSVLEMKRVAREKATLVAVEANALNPQMIAIGLIYYSVDKGVFKNTSSKLSNIFLEAGLHNVQVTETECLPRHTLFEYRSPLIRFLNLHNSCTLRLLASIETNWQKHAFLSKFSNYLIVSGFKKSCHT